MQAHRNPFLVAIKTSTEFYDDAKKYLQEAHKLRDEATSSVLKFVMHINNNDCLEKRNEAIYAIRKAEQYVENKTEILLKIDFSQFDDKTEILIDQHIELLEEVGKELETMTRTVDSIDQSP